MARNNLMNDLFYGELLSTPGYDVDFAVGMTYSMDLEALLTVPMALGAFGELNETTQKSPLYLLEAVRKSAKKFLVFCNKGQIKVPKDCRKIYSMLEDSVCEVFSKAHEDGQQNAQFSNFHPKVWLIRETKRNDKTYSQMRVVILSRNLTFDNSLDTAVAMTGRIVTDHEVDSSKQQPLISMLNDLHKFVNNEQWKNIEGKIIDGLNKVERFEIGNTFNDYDFIVYNPDGTVYTSIPENRYNMMQGLDSFIFSPFIDIDTLKWMTWHKPIKRDRVLVTRRESVTKEIFDYYSSIGGKIYAVREEMLDKDIMEDAGVNDEFKPVDLHSKMYFFQSPHYKAGRYLFMGSANATRTAFSLPDGSYKGHLNTEILIRLKYKGTEHFSENIYEEFLNEGPECKFELISNTFVPSSDTSVKYSESERLMKYIISGDMLKASCTKAENGLYNVTITFRGTRLLGRHSSCSVTLAPLQYPALTRPLANGLVFDKMPADVLSEFYILTVTNDNDSEDKSECVIKISTSGIPTERVEMIFRSFVDTEEKFLKYISLLLTDSPNLALSELGLVEGHDESSGKKDGRKIAPQFYEQLLRIAATEPERLKDVNKVIDMIDSKTVPESFWRMYNSFKSLSQKLKKL